MIVVSVISRSENLKIREDILRKRGKCAQGDTLHKMTDISFVSQKLNDVDEFNSYHVKDCY